MPFVTKDWRDSPGDLTTPITAAALENLETRTTAGIPYENVAWHGAVAGNVGDQTAAIQAAIDAAAASSGGSVGGTVFIPKGSYRMLGSLQLRENVSLIGEGKTASGLNWPTSLGPNTWALTPDQTNGYARHGRISGLRFQGPGTWTGAWDVPVSDMNGVWIASRQVIEHCDIAFFHRGLGVEGNHLQVINCGVTPNTYNLVFVESGVGGDLGGGDHHYASCDFSGAAIASIYIEGPHGIGGSLFLGTHMGFCPYGILSKPGRTDLRFISATTFIECPFEFFGTAAIWGSNAIDLIMSSQWIGCSSIQGNASGTPPPTTPYEFFIRAGQIVSCVFDTDSLLPDSPSAPGTAYFSASGGGNSLLALEFRGGGNPELFDNNTRFLHRTDGNGPAHCSFSGVDGRATGAFFVVYAGTAVVQNDLVRLTDFGSCAKYDTAGRAPLGVALQSGAVGEIVGVQTTGYASLVADGVIASNGRPLKPAATAGRVVQATDFNDGPIVGVSIDAGTAGNAFAAHLRCGTWG